jgi:phytoene dehydrogenase-like protein
MGPLLTQVPPKIGSHRPSDLVDLARLAWSQRGVTVRTTADVTRLLTMSIADLLDDWFESPQIKGALAVNGVIGTWAGPYEPGTAYVMAHHSIGDVGDGQLGSWGYPEGGMGAVSEAIARSARGFGAEIRTNARVARLLVRGGRVHGAVLENGDEIHAPLVVTTLHPKTAFLEHIPRAELPDEFATDIEHWKTRSGVVKINLALAELPNFTADPSRGMAEHHTSRRRSRTRARVGPRCCRSATASSRPRWTRR